MGQAGNGLPRFVVKHPAAKAVAPSMKKGRRQPLFFRTHWSCLVLLHGVTVLCIFPNFSLDLCEHFLYHLTLNRGIFAARPHLGPQFRILRPPAWPRTQSPARPLSHLLDMTFAQGASCSWWQQDWQ